MEKKRYLTAMGKNVENITADELKEVDTAKLAKEHAEKANKKKEEEERKIKEASKQVRTVYPTCDIFSLLLMLPTHCSSTTSSGPSE